MDSPQPSRRWPYLLRALFALAVLTGCWLAVERDAVKRRNARIGRIANATAIVPGGLELRTWSQWLFDGLPIRLIELANDHVPDAALLHQARCLATDFPEARIGYYGQDPPYFMVVSRPDPVEIGTAAHIVSADPLLP